MVKESDISALVKSGKILTVAEWRSGTKEKRSGTSNGRAYTICEATHNVEVAGTPQTFKQRIEEKDYDAFQLPQKGQSVVVLFEAQKADRNTFYLNTTILPLKAA